MPSRQISDLCEELQGLCVQHLALANGDSLFKKKNATAFVTCTFRSGEEQDFEYSKGRTTKGVQCLCWKKLNSVGSCQRHPLGLTVTNAKAGESPHNIEIDGKPSAMAYDLAIRLPDGSCDWNEVSDLWARITSLGLSLGLRSGSDWGDSPHFEIKGWKDKVNAEK